MLEGSASRAIKGLTLTSANYDNAISILKERYGKTQQTIAAHMDEILKIQACNTDRTSQLRYVYDKISVHVRGLASLGVSSEQYGSMLIPIIMSKIPNEIRLVIARKNTAKVWNIDELLDTIKVEIEAREVSEGVQSSLQSTKKHCCSTDRRGVRGEWRQLRETSDTMRLLRRTALFRFVRKCSG